MKVFALNDCEWWAAESLTEAKAHYLKYTGIEEADGPFVDAHELDDKAMDRLQFSKEDGSIVSFRVRLDAMISSGHEFPCFFASTEY